jgi:hypothetical protein
MSQQVANFHHYVENGASVAGNLVTGQLLLGRRTAQTLKQI